MNIAADSELDISLTCLRLSLAGDEVARERLFTDCRGHRKEYGFTSKRGITPCASFDVLERFASSYHDRLGYLRHLAKDAKYQPTRVEACEGCCGLQLWGSTE